MEVVVRLATARPCGGPVGTGEEGGRNVYRSYSDLLIHAVMAGALLLLHKGCSRCAWNVKELYTTFTVQRNFHNHTMLYTYKLTIIGRLQ